MAKPPKKPVKENINFDDQAKRDEAILKASRDQSKVDADRTETNATYKNRQKTITANLRKVGISRKAFQVEYDIWMAQEDAKNKQEKDKAKAEETLFRAECGAVYAALRGGSQMDMLDIIKAAPKARETIARAEAAGKGGETDL